uniref:AlNc14C114G6479 protein n=1 Tax=Albugo laibachii Nc14 TaxID=890382 RepID=F0WIU4_9STRA|nr:AlNc14C114G6479 [Albugo laibachii Nc14]|eukprot:CCA21188.1 AlNc14C114G6479 [Albugo laibachii Nc14]
MYSSNRVDECFTLLFGILLKIPQWIGSFRPFLEFLEHFQALIIGIGTSISVSRSANTQDSVPMFPSTAASSRYFFTRAISIASVTSSSVSILKSNCTSATNTMESTEFLFNTALTPSFLLTILSNGFSSFPFP